MNSESQLKILAVGSYCEAVDQATALQDLKSLVKESTGVAVRRVSRFVQLALIGAGRCCHDIRLAPDAAVYFSSCRGDTEVTATLLDDLVGRRELPSPLTFVNSVSNAGCFHVACVLGLQSRSNFIANRYDPLVAVLKSAWVDIARDEVTTALTGTVDACSMPLANHRRRLQVDPDMLVGEASHWLLVAPATDPRPGRAVISALRNFSSREQLHQWLMSAAWPRDAVLATGQHLSESDAERIAEVTGISRRYPYREALPYYDSQTGAAIEGFIRDREEEVMLHVNSDPSGRYSVIRVER